MTRLSPRRLANLANALGVSTPIPADNQIKISTTTSRSLLHVIPPSSLDSFRRGTLVPLLSTLQAQLAAIAREYALPTTAGLILYLIIDDIPGPSISDHIWKLLWSRVLFSERSPSLPILAKVEFDIDKRKATWFEPWLKNTRHKKIPRNPTAPLLLLSKRSQQDFPPQSPAPINPEKDPENVLNLLELMSKPKSPSSSSSDTIHDTSKNSFLAYNNEPEDIEISMNYRDSKREFAVFNVDDLHLDLDFDENDPNDRRKSQLLMRAKLDEIERTMAQLSPRILHTDLSLSLSPNSPNSPSVSPASPNFLSPRTEPSFVTSSPPRLESINEDAKSWPAIPFSFIKETQTPNPTVNVNSNAPPTLALNGISTQPPRLRPPPLPLNQHRDGPIMTETEKRRLEQQPERDVSPIPLSPDPFGRYPSSSSPPPLTIQTKSRFSVDSALSDDPPQALASAATKNGVTNRTTLMSVKTIKRLWRKSKEREKNGVPPTPMTPVFGFGSGNVIGAAGSGEVDKSLPAIPPPSPVPPQQPRGTDPVQGQAPQRPERPSEESLDLPDISMSMQAVVPPIGRMSASALNGGRRTPQDRDQLMIPSSLERRGSPVSPTTPVEGMMPGVGGRRTPQTLKEQQQGGGVPPPPRPISRPSLVQDGMIPSQVQMQTGRRTPQEQQQGVVAPPRPNSRPSLDQVPLPANTPAQHSRRPSQPVRQPPPPPHQHHLRHPSHPQPPSQQHLRHPSHPQPPPHQHLRHPSHPHPLPHELPTYQGRNPHNTRPVTPVLAMHPQQPVRSMSGSSSSSSSAGGGAGAGGGQDKLDVNRLMFDQESPYPVRLPSGNGGGGMVGIGSASVGVVALPQAPAPVPTPVPAVAPTPVVPPPPQPPTSEQERSTATMRKSILKWKIANPNVNGNGNVNPVSEIPPSSSSSSSSSTSSSGTSTVLPRRSLERPGRGGGRRPSVIHFGSSSSNNMQVQKKQTNPDLDLNPKDTLSSFPIPLPTSQQHPTTMTRTPSPATSILERRSDASSFVDMTEFEFVSPVLRSSATLHR